MRRNVKEKLSTELILVSHREIFFCNSLVLREKINIKLRTQVGGIYSANLKLESRDSGGFAQKT